MNWRVFVLILGLGLWGSWGWGQCWPASFIPTKVVYFTGNLNSEIFINSVLPGDLIELKSIDPNYYYDIRIRKRGNEGKHSMTVFDDNQNIYQYCREYCKLLQADTIPRVIYKMPTYTTFSRPRLFIYITDEISQSCGISSNKVRVSIKASSVAPSIYNPCGPTGARLNGSGPDFQLNTLFNQSYGDVTIITRETGISGDDLRIGPRDSCGDFNGFHPAPVFNHSGITEPCSGVNNTLVMAFDPPADGTYRFEWESEQACSTELFVFEDKKMFSYNRWFGYIPDFEDWMDPVLQESIRNEMGIGLNGDPEQTNFVSPCSHQGAGNVGKMNSGSVCCGSGFDMDIDKIYFLVFTGDICCGFCVDLNIRFCSDAGTFLHTVDPVLDDSLKIALSQDTNFLSPPCIFFPVNPSHQRIASPHPITPKSSTPITFTQATQTRLTLFSYTNAADPNTWNTIPATAQVEKGDSTHYTFNLQAGRQYLVQTDDDDPASLYRLKPKLTAPIPPTAPSPQSGKRRRRRQRSDGAVP